MLQRQGVLLQTMHARRHSLRLSLVRNVEHVAAYIDAKPDVSGFLQRFAAQAASAANVQNEARLFWLRWRVKCP